MKEDRPLVLAMSRVCRIHSNICFSCSFGRVSRVHRQKNNRQHHSSNVVGNVIFRTPRETIRIMHLCLDGAPVRQSTTGNVFPALSKLTPPLEPDAPPRHGRGNFLFPIIILLMIQLVYPLAVFGAPGMSAYPMVYCNCHHRACAVCRNHDLCS